MVYDAVAVQEENVDHVPNFNDVRTQLERYRAALVPPIPYEVEDVVIPEELTGTESGRRVIPFVMGLMTERTIWAYRQIFQHVKARVRQVTRHHLRPQRVLMDFEVGLMTATETEVGNSDCGFMPVTANAFELSKWSRQAHSDEQQELARKGICRNMHSLVKNKRLLFDVSSKDCWD
uniref:MULE transposase domain-containing protein n=1 Tax=Branchiostoma floridae TaxID=7739 RepID=C3ZUR6_BRAFL|eukprot:XP_002587767.1 hypothetical protein BRAFLDRAFT_94670 [Branchiostoma floridae]